MTVERRQRICALNDQLRRLHTGGRIFITQGIIALGADMVRAALRATQEFDQFDERNDPYGEHDFGAVTVGKHRVFWKICQSASKRDPLSACNRDPLLVFGMDVTSAPLARVGA